MTNSPRELFAAMPKAEVHLHLEGTISPDVLWRMSQRNSVELPASSLEELRQSYRFENFDKFIEPWLSMCRCLKTEADYIDMVDNYVSECRRQNIRYVEAHFTPYNHEVLGIGGSKALEIVTRRLLEAEGQSGPVTRLILDIPSESVEDSGPYTIDLLEGLHNPIVVAIGLGGPEVGFPRTLVTEHFSRARKAGYSCVAHAGETGPAEHVAQAVESLGARRVQHGVQAVQSTEVLQMFDEREICCDVALTSNRLLTSFTDLEKHPLPAMLEAGIPLTLSTDDPTFFSTDLVAEYQLAQDTFGLSVDQLWEMNLNGLRYGLASVPTRRALYREFTSRWGQLVGATS